MFLFVREMWVPGLQCEFQGSKIKNRKRRQWVRLPLSYRGWGVISGLEIMFLLNIMALLRVVWYYHFHCSPSWYWRPLSFSFLFIRLNSPLSNFLATDEALGTHPTVFVWILEGLPLGIISYATQNPVVTQWTFSASESQKWKAFLRLCSSCPSPLFQMSITPSFCQHDW